jgi:hypothetical protein
MRCSRIGCGAEAVATFCFDARATLVWVDSLDPVRGTGAGVLCRRHADALTPPRGWHLQDRRTGRPRLWEERPLAPHRPRRRTPAADDTGATDRAAPSTGVQVDTLPFDDARPPSRDASDDVLDPRTPLLARAFAGVRPR